MDEIRLVTVPKISHRLKELGESVTTRLVELNIDSLIATDDTLKTLKSLRADLNKELTSFEDQRKFVKNGILNPYNEFEGLYKTEISDKYKNAIDVLKTKIEIVESRIKDEKKGKVILYFQELCAAEEIDFIRFDQIGLEINLSTTEKAYKEKCSDFINRVKDDLNLIHSSEFQAEILTEYKRTLNASQSIVTVKTRKENERLEAERIRQAEIAKRKSMLTYLGLVYDDFSKSYVWDSEIYISADSVANLSNEEFSKKTIELQERIKSKQQNNAPASTPPSPAQSEMSFSAPEPLKAPVPAEELVTASFKVTGTLSQLQALGQYMRVNKITYINID